MKVLFKPGEVEGIAETMKSIDAENRVKLRKLCDYVGIRTIEYLRELIDEYRPPIRPGEPARRARQGHWADQSGNLARAYAYELEESRHHITIVFSNAMEYAAALDVKEGFFVLRGVADKGGPVEQALRRAIDIIAPEVELRYE